MGKTNMKIQITPEKKIKDVFSVWHEETSDTDLIVDTRYLQCFKSGSLKTIYAFGLLGITEPDRIVYVLKNLVKSLKVGGELYIIEQDFDYIIRSLLGGDLTLEEFNKEHRKKTYLNQDLIVEYLEKAGFPVKEQKWWKEGVQFNKKNSEIIISGIKNNNQSYE
jgi:predicted SAM-dependent methyltransferase